MRLRVLATAVGTGVTTFLLVAVLVIELLDFEFSAILGLPVGLLAGLAAVAVVVTGYGVVRPPVRWTLDALAGFGYGVLAALAGSYVNLGGLRSSLTTNRMVLVGVAVGVAAFVVGWALDRRADTRR